MDIQTICVVITCCLTVGGMLIYFGKSLGTLQRIDANQTILFRESKTNTTDIANLKVELTQVKTRQEDCEKCP